MADTKDMPVNVDFSCVRGDTFTKKIDLYIKNGDEETEYEFQEGDVLKFGLSKGYKHKAGYSLIKEKNIPTDTRILELTNEETEAIEYGKYNYDIEFYRAADSYTKTLFQGQFEIAKESI